MISIDRIGYGYIELVYSPDLNPLNT